MNGGDDTFDDEFEDIQRLIDQVDLDELVRTVDRLCERREWDHLVRTRTAARAAITTGRQVWPIATLCEFRVALLAPAEWACRILDAQTGAFSIGPLSEVVAQNHTWSELEPHLEHGPIREIVAHERVLRGESLDAADVGSLVFDLPRHLEDWEPDYPLAVYSETGLTASCPIDHWTHEWSVVEAHTADVTILDDEDTETALRSLVEPWTADSVGRAQCLVVEGGLDSLVAATQWSQVRATRLDAHAALQWLAWCGASGGAHGRRRGAAAGRFSTWWMLAALGGCAPDWDRLEATHTLGSTIGSIAGSLQWWRVDSGDRHAYSLSVCAHDAEEGITVGLFASDDS